MEAQCSRGRVQKPWIGHFVSRHDSYDTQGVEGDNQGKAPL